MRNNIQPDEIEWRDPYADYFKATQNKKSEVDAEGQQGSGVLEKRVDEINYNEDTPTYTAIDIYNALNGKEDGKKSKVSISATLSVFSKEDMEHPLSKGEIAFGNATIDMQRREDTVQIRIEPAVTGISEAKSFWKLLEDYGETTEKLYDDPDKLVVLFVCFIPQDKPYMFMNITNPLFWALQNSQYDGGNQQIRILVPTQMIEFSVSNMDQNVLEKEVDAEIDAETNSIIRENIILEKEIANIEEQIKAEETMEEFSDKEKEDDSEED